MINSSVAFTISFFLTNWQDGHILLRTPRHTESPSESRIFSQPEQNRSHLAQINLQVQRLWSPGFPLVALFGHQRAARRICTSLFSLEDVTVCLLIVPKQRPEGQTFRVNHGHIEESIGRSHWLQNAQNTNQVGPSETTCWPGQSQTGQKRLCFHWRRKRIWGFRDPR